MDRWKLISESTMGAYMLANKSGEYVLYSDYAKLHKRTCDLEMKYAKKSGDDFKRYKNCHEAQAEIDRWIELCKVHDEIGDTLQADVVSLQAGIDELVDLILKLAANASEEDKKAVYLLLMRYKTKT